MTTTINTTGDKTMLLPPNDSGSKIATIDRGQTRDYHEQIFNQSKSKSTSKSRPAAVRWSQLQTVLSVAAITISIAASGLCLFTQLSVSARLETTDSVQLHLFDLESEIALLRSRLDETTAHTRQKRSAATTSECSCPPGPPGPKGSTGPRGLAGPKGPKGEKGEFQLQLTRSNVRRSIEVDGQVQEVEVYTENGLMLPFFSFKGDRGLPGHPGVAGPPGEKGVPGETGVGVAGPIGPKGDKGDRGERGFPGVSGPIGARGEKGDRGEITGNITSLLQGVPIRGEKGEKGDSGSRGARGKKGDAGQRGLPGNSGKIGLPGRPGEVGPPGPTAERGEKGEKGECLQKIMFENGTVIIVNDGESNGPSVASFSTNEVIAAVRGTRDVSGNQKLPLSSGQSDVRYIQGPPGPPGPPGPKGDRGDRGSMGLPGPYGAAGPKGEMGPKGEKGDLLSSAPRTPKGSGVIAERKARQTPEGRKSQRKSRSDSASARVTDA